MTDIINEKWELVRRADPTTGDEPTEEHGYEVCYGSTREVDGCRASLMCDDCYYNRAPDLPVAQYITDIHNFIVEHGGLESVQRDLRALRALESGGVDNWAGYEYVDWNWVATGVETSD